MDPREYDIKQKFLDLDAAIRTSSNDATLMKNSITALSELQLAVMDLIAHYKGGSLV
jgi:hypothetical protein